jgi:hypothetical protein
MTGGVKNRWRRAAGPAKINVSLIYRPDGP